jgi:hypothetical protein
VDKKTQYVEHLRAQAQRCFRFAEDADDEAFGWSLISIGLELEAEADALAGARRAPSLPIPQQGLYNGRPVTPLDATRRDNRPRASSC